MYSAQPLRPVEPSREEWCGGRRLDQLHAVFQSGEMMRCPAARVRSSGRRVMCGAQLGRAPANIQRAVVRAIEGLSPIVGSEHRPRKCSSCHKTVDVFLIPEAQRLEATG